MNDLKEILPSNEGYIKCQPHQTDQASRQFNVVEQRVNASSCDCLDTGRIPGSGRGNPFREVAADLQRVSGMRFSNQGETFERINVFERVLNVDEVYYMTLWQSKLTGLIYERLPQDGGVSLEGRHFVVVPTATTNNGNVIPGHRR